MSFEDRLRQQFENAQRQMPTSSVDWATTIARAKKERIYRTALLAAAVVLVAGGGILSAQGLLDSDTPSLPAPAGTLEQAPTPQETSTESATEATLAGERVLEWVRTLSEDNPAAAWAMMSAPAKDYFGSLESFKKDFMQAYVEGWASWHSATSRQVDTHVLVSSGDGALAVVTVYGEVTKEGPPSYEADSVAVRISGGQALVEPYSSKLEIQPIEPEFQETYTTSSLPEEFTAEVPSDVAQVNFFVEGGQHDGRLASVDQMERQGSQPPNSIASVAVPEGLAPGPHFLTVAAVDQNGEVSVEVIPFTLEG